MPARADESESSNLHNSRVMHRRASHCLPLRPRTATNAFLRFASTSPRHPKANRTSHYGSLSKTEFQKLKRHTMTVIDRAAPAQANSEWKHTPSHRGEEKRLLASLQNAAASRSPSKDKEVYEDDSFSDVGDGEALGLSSLPLGTFVETRRQVMYHSCMRCVT